MCVYVRKMSIGKRDFVNHFLKENRARINKICDMWLNMTNSAHFLVMQLLGEYDDDKIELSTLENIFSEVNTYVTTIPVEYEIENEKLFQAIGKIDKLLDVIEKTWSELNSDGRKIFYVLSKAETIRYHRRFGLCEVSYFSEATQCAASVYSMLEQAKN